MPRYDIRCLTCGRVVRNLVLTAGDHPTCACGQPTEYLWDSPVSHGIETDEKFIGGVTIENLTDHPITVYSRQEFEQAKAKYGAEQRIKYVPGDRHLTNWALAIDPQTLENARVLLSRPKAMRVGESDYGKLETFEAHFNVVPKGA